MMHNLAEKDPRAYKTIAEDNGVTCTELKKLIEQGAAKVDPQKKLAVK